MIKAVKVGDCQFVNAIDHPCITSSDGVEPAAAALAPRCRTKLASHAMKHLRQLHVYSGQRSLANPPGVSLHHDHHSDHSMGKNTSTSACAAHCRVCRRHKRI